MYCIAAYFRCISFFYHNVDFPMVLARFNFAPMSLLLLIIAISPFDVFGEIGETIPYHISLLYDRTCMCMAAHFRGVPNLVQSA